MGRERGPRHRHRVIGTGRPESQAFIAGLGAIPGTLGLGLAERIRALDVGRVDFALDAAGAGSLVDLVAVTGSASAVLTIADFTGPEIGVGVSMGEFGGEPDGRHGLSLAALLSEERRFRMQVREVFPMAGDVAAGPGQCSSCWTAARSPTRPTRTGTATAATGWTAPSAP